MHELNYKDEIEALQEESDFEAKGDAKYLDHEDDEARLQWAFYRPSGSHAKQVADRDVLVSIMAFNHSRLTSLERFDLLNPEVINNAALRVKIRNRSRMLFRAMVDDNFEELVLVLEKYPMFLDLAYDQMINGRIWNENYANPVAASKFLELSQTILDEKLEEGVKRRLQPLKGFSQDEAKEYLALLTNQVQNLHKIIKVHYAEAFELWLQHIQMHPLQKILWQKHINLLKENR
ncbi:MAG: hypothetical protein GW906_01650 [Epsilonproteobacteria bacterium]|nr:hypothetical protein [Campylobacterota bacterium]OIO15449.1 MAG: hypothetical protein AUJ81_07180 [Helicobacteraceae bacterium CG1_02_36_14]PIP10981.1 MAG: hypothetical protein COX50_02980 [Sulfurimonas sp. CG23_combo_of_CG06-09_8_20_14_all_36_33]PIS25789.1 MAG: hypothetical protein COT46_04820 [Sulfurimonas sp. CG08_land_8_20_14_0_20_36_33]PIU34389.1 MAG: hypothetical protein COT05_07765 [Sulfurimonas sp. CG07_land_8_20_14_0_80_36_56]PIV02731.1 MAG: hypothetical protein COS56_10875 [Sulfur